MPETTIIADSILAVDIGSVTTRVALLDVAAGSYRFVAGGQSPTTAEPPFANVAEGLHRALQELRAVTGRAFEDDDARLIMPTGSDGAGVDALVATTSAGQPLNTVLVGLMPDVSVESARRAAASTYLRVAEALDLADHRREDQQINAILQAKPDMVIIAGGTENGAAKAVLRLAETVALAAHLIPEGRRPRVLFCGNAAVGEQIKETFGNTAAVSVTDNVRPGLEQEAIDGARRELAALYQSQRIQAIAGYAEIAQWSAGRLWPTAHAFGQTVRLLSRLYDPDKGVLGVDIGSAATSIAAGFQGQLALTVRPDLGVGHSAAGVLAQTALDKMARWLPVEVSDDHIRDYVYNKTLHPATSPHDLAELYLEHALARQSVRAALPQARTGWPPGAKGARPDLLPWFEPIIGSGAVLAEAPRPGHAALILLDAFQPTGITTLVLDAHSLTASLGAVAAINPAATIQILETGSFINLGTVLSGVGRARVGDTVARLKLTREGGEALNVEVKFGSLEVLPLLPGETAKLSVQPLRRFDLGFGAGRGGTVHVNGGAIGLMVDARGRPIHFPADAAKRRQMVQQWIWDMGG